MIFLNPNLGKFKGEKENKKNSCGITGDIYVNSFFSNNAAPDIRECLALFFLEREYGLDTKLKQN